MRAAGGFWRSLSVHCYNAKFTPVRANAQVETESAMQAPWPTHPYEHR